MNTHPARLRTDRPAAGGSAESDSQLATRAAQGDAHAFELIMRRHNRLLFRTARSILRGDAEAEDAVQEAYLKAWRALGSFRDEARLSTWLVRIVLNEALGRARRGAPVVVPLEIVMDAPDGPRETAAQADPDQQPDRAAARAQVRRLIEARIDALPEVFRTVFMLRAVQELSVDEVADLLRVPPATVRTRFFRARALLRESLSRDIDFAIEDAFSFAGARCDRIVARVLVRIAADGQTPPAV